MQRYSIDNVGKMLYLDSSNQVTVKRINRALIGTSPAFSTASGSKASTIASSIKTN